MTHYLSILSKDESGEIEFAEFVKLASRFVEPEEVLFK